MVLSIPNDEWHSERKNKNGNSLHTYPLSFLQIGDMPAYISKASLHLSKSTRKIIIFVDNSPWTSHIHKSKSVLYWQLLILKAKNSLFTNQKASALNSSGSLVNSPESSKTNSNIHSNHHNKFRHYAGKLKRIKWKSMATFLKRTHSRRRHLMINNSDLSKFRGCVTFELSWEDVRGIQYSNELQMDTYLALELKNILKREFEDVDQAIKFHSSQLQESTSEEDNFPKYFWGPSGQNEVNSVDSSPKSVLQSHFSSANGSREEEGPSESPNNLEKIREILSERPRKHVFHEGFETALQSPVEKGERPFPVPGVSPNSLLFREILSRKGGKVEEMEEGNGEYSASGPERGEISISEGDSKGGNEGESEGKFEGNSPPESSSSLHDIAEIAEAENGWEEGENEWEIGGNGGFSTAVHSRQPSMKNSDAFFPETSPFAPHNYRDKLVIIRFKDLVLPSELADIITADLNLLKMVESGLPSWAVFCQSYPVLSHLYRPWMRPLALYIYFAVSVTTFLIGFYDLYKNVPVLREGLSRVLGPVYGWIGSWGVVYRLEYLGTILFLQNFQRGLNSAYALIETTGQLLYTIFRPLEGPVSLLMSAFLPAWQSLSWGCGILLRETQIFSWKMGWSLWALGNLLYRISLLVLKPLFQFSGLVWGLVMGLLWPILSLFSLILKFPMALVSALQSFIFGAFLLLSRVGKYLVFGSKLVWNSREPMAQAVRAARQSTPLTAVARDLWNDFFHKVFKATRSIVNGLILFLLACNRHRLSTYHSCVAQWNYWCHRFSRVQEITQNSEQENRQVERSLNHTGTPEKQKRWSESMLCRDEDENLRLRVKEEAEYDEFKWNKFSIESMALTEADKGSLRLRRKLFSQVNKE